MIRACIALLALVLALGPARAQPLAPLSQGTRDALLHVVAHEIGHAVLREFDLPILGPEEAIADDFATVYVHMIFPERAAAIVAARARQNMADGEEAGAFSEYRDDDQRAGRMVCLLYGLDPDRYDGLRGAFGIDEDAATECRDFGPEVGRSWRRTLAPYRMPEGARVTEAFIGFEDAGLHAAMTRDGLREDVLALLSGIDWHSAIRVSIERCKGSAGWSRNGRRIRICDAYLERFERQLGG